MAVIGCLGDIVFQVSDKTVVTLNNWKWSGAAKYAVHERHGLRPLTELTGVEPDKITFEIQLRAELGVSPNKEAIKIWWYERKGTPLPLTIGKYAYGFYRWNIVSHEISVDYTDPEGNVAGSTVSITLQESLKG